MMLAVGHAFVSEEAAMAYSALDGGRLQGAAAIAGIGSSGIPVGLTLSVTFLPLLFPDGRLPSHRWRLPALAVALVVASALLTRAFTGDASQVTRAMVFGVGLAVAACIGSPALRDLRYARARRKAIQR